MLKGREFTLHDRYIGHLCSASLALPNQRVAVVLALSHSQNRVKIRLNLFITASNLYLYLYGNIWTLYESKGRVSTPWLVSDFSNQPHHRFGDVGFLWTRALSSVSWK